MECHLFYKPIKKKETMTLQTGDLDQENKAPKNDVEVLTEMVRKLQLELKEIKLGNTQVGPGSNVDLVKALAEFSAAQKNAENLDFQAGIREEDIPKDDYDEEGVLFCAPFTGYAISDDRRLGHRVVLPYNKPFILFEFEGVKPMQEGKHIKLMNMCKYRSQSKKEIEWLRNYTFFNTFIYESTRGIVNFDVLKAQKLAKIMAHIVNFEMPQLIKTCDDYKVPITASDISVMRTSLAMKMAESELARDQDSTRRRLEEIEKEKILLQQARN